MPPQIIYLFDVKSLTRHIVYCFLFLSLTCIQAYSQIIIRGGSSNQTPSSTKPVKTNEGKEVVLRMVTGVTVEKIESGKNKDKSKNKPLSLSRIYVMKPDGTKAVGTITLDDGVFRFQVPDGKYEVLIENQGHKSYKTTLEVSGQDINLGEITLEIGEEISAASISDKSLVHRYGTRIKYDVWRDPDKSKISMTEMISRIPDLRLSHVDGKLVFNNEKFYKILIDKEENGLINNARQYPMEFIKAHYMKDIVVVLPGDPEYHNDAPILLINLAADLPFGVAANLAMSATTKNRYSPSVDAVMNTPIIGVGVSYSYYYDKAPTLTNEYMREMLSSDSQIACQESSQSSRDESKGHNISTNLFRSFANDLVQFNATLKTSYDDASSLSESISRTLDADGSVLSSDRSTVRGQSNSPFRLNAAFRLRGNFGKQIGAINRQRANRWKVEYSFNDNGNDRTDDYQSYVLHSSSGRKEHRLNSSLSSYILHGPVDLLGAANFNYYDRKYDELSDYSGSSSGFDYRQRVINGNISLNGFFLKKKLGISASIRPEYLDNEGYYVNGTSRSPLDYDSFSLTPQVGLSYGFKYFSSSFSYSRNLKRPNVNQLNPYEDRSNPYYIKTGNPELKGSTTDAYSLRIMPRFRPGLLLMPMFLFSYSKTEGLISGITKAFDDGTAVKTYINSGNSESFGVSFITGLKLCKRFELDPSFTYGRNRTTLPSGMINSFNSFSASLSGRWTPKWFELSTSASLSPTLSSIQSSTLKFEPDVNMSLARYFKKIHLGASVSVTDLLHSGGRMESVIHDLNFIQRNYTERRGRMFSFKVYWRFGRFKNAETVEVSAYDM